MAEVFHMLKALVEAGGVEVDLSAFDIFEKEDPYGEFDPRFVPHLSPSICIYCINGDAKYPDDVFDTCTLAHEYGHFLAWKNGERTPEYEETIKEEVLTEESRAWRYGRPALEGVGPGAVRPTRTCIGGGPFTAWGEYEKREREGLERYRALLGVDFHA